MAFLAIIPLAKLLGFGTEELSLRVGQTIGGLLNATLGNVVELIVAILALVKCELQIVQSSLLGSILSNVLLVLGMCFFAGGLRFSEQSFGDAGAQINSSLLLISVIAILLPAGYHAAFGGTVQEQDSVLAMSRGTAVILLAIYFAYMVFQLWSHSHLFSEGGEDTEMKTRNVGKHTMFKKAKSVKRADAAAGKPSTTKAGPADLNTTATSGTDETVAAEYEEDEEEEEQPSINFWSCVILLLVVAGLVGVTAEWLVDSINGLVATGGISEQWVGLILLPIVGNAAEHVTGKYHTSSMLLQLITVRSGHGVVQGQARSLYRSGSRLLHPDRALRHSRPCHPRMDPGQASQPALRPLRVGHAIPDGLARTINHGRREVQLA